MKARAASKTAKQLHEKLREELRDFAEAMRKLAETDEKVERPGVADMFRTGSHEREER